jgi:hypothetical protein
MTPEQPPPMVELQNLLISAESVEDFLSGLSGVAATTLSGRNRSTIDCGITFQEGSRRVTVAGSSPRAVRLDQIGQRMGQGPCIAALRTLAPVLLLMKIKAAQATAGELRSALESQTPVNIACGIIMAQNRCSQNEALSILTNASKASDKTLQDLAKELVTHLSGETPATFFQS